MPFRNGNEVLKKRQTFLKHQRPTIIAFKLNFTLLLCRFGTAKVQRYFHFFSKKLKDYFFVFLSFSCGTVKNPILTNV